MKNEISEHVVDETINHIYQNVWKEKRIKSVGKMAPTHAFKASQSTFHKIARLWSKNRPQPSTKMKQFEPLQPERENFISGKALIHEKKQNLSSKSSKIFNRKTRSLNRNKSMFEKKEEKSSQRCREPKSQSYDKIQPLKQQQEKPRIQDQFIEMQTNLLRIRMQNIEKTKLEQQRIQKQRTQSRLAEQNKIFRKFQQIKRLVYDYSGALYNGHQKHQDSPKIYHLEEKINDAKIQLREQHQVEAIEQTIDNLRNEQKRQRLKTITGKTGGALSTYFLDKLSERDQLSEGVKIRQQGSYFLKEKKYNRDGRNSTLNDFRKQIKNKRFIPFKQKNIQRGRQKKKQSQTNHKSQQKLKIRIDDDEKKIPQRMVVTNRRFKTAKEEESSFNESHFSRKGLKEKRTDKISIENNSIYSEIITKTG